KSTKTRTGSSHAEDSSGQRDRIPRWYIPKLLSKSNAKQSPDPIDLAIDWYFTQLIQKI
ncbi:unnamed protein product, partial [Musa acuminata var. zebrina]